LGGICALFWYQEVQYFLPTEVPVDFKYVAVGAKVDLDFVPENDKATLLHFYNPNCPCSKFNFSNFESIQHQYQAELNTFLIVQDTEEGLSNRFKKVLEELDITVIVDNQKQYAKSCGVYATPQIALLNDNKELYYKGNYNQSRYCTNPETNFARIAVEELLNNSLTPQFGSIATKAYGCDLNKTTR